MAQLLKLGGATIKQPTSFNLESYVLTKGGRSTDGTMHLDKIAKKRKFLFTYDVLRGDNLTTILNIIDDTNMFFTIEYKDNTGAAKTATVYVGAIKKEQFRTDGLWVWKDVAFDLIEQ